MNSTIAVQALGALAQETRLAVFRLLVQAGEPGLSVGKLAEALGAKPDGRLTFHLKELVAAGLISSRAEGRFVFYRANYEAMNGLLAYLTENCCGGGDKGQGAFGGICNTDVACCPEAPV